MDPMLAYRSDSYKKTVVFDPCKSETYRALQEGAGEGLQEVPNPIQPKTFHANRLVPGKVSSRYRAPVDSGRVLEC